MRDFGNMTLWTYHPSPHHSTHPLSLLLFTSPIYLISLSVPTRRDRHTRSDPQIQIQIQIRTPPPNLYVKPVAYDGRYGADSIMINSSQNPPPSRDRKVHRKDTYIGRGINKNHNISPTPPPIYPPQYIYMFDSGRYE